LTESFLSALTGINLEGEIKSSITPFISSMYIATYLEQLLTGSFCTLLSFDVTPIGSLIFKRRHHAANASGNNTIAEVIGNIPGIFLENTVVESHQPFQDETARN